MKSKRIFIFVVLALIVFGGGLLLAAKRLVVPLSFLSPSQPQFSLSEFARKVLQASEPERGAGFLPDPPRTRLKQAERFIKDRVKSDVKITYDFYSSYSGPNSSHSLVLYAAPEPFRWRTDLIMNLDGKDYKATFVNDGTGYLTCQAEGSEPLKCNQQPIDYLEEYFMPVPLLTDFLNDIFDTLTLRKLMVSGLKDERTIADYQANCQVVEDEYGILDYCLDKDTNYLLYLDSQRKNISGKIASQFTLKAQSVDLSPLPDEVFTSP